jgi:hypothetical protein
MSNVTQEPRKSVPANTVTMDSRKFLSAINGSAESQIKFLSESVTRLGLEQGKDWNLAATAADRIFIEDVNSGEYLVADYTRQKGGQVRIGNIRKVQITEGEKSPHFGSACMALVEGIQTNDVKATENAFSRITASRFRSTAVPNSGLVRTKDGTVRHISVRTDMMNEEVQDRLISTIVSELSDRVVISEGEVSGTFSNEKFRLPVSPLMERRVVAYNMREAARNAYWNAEFQNLAYTVAGHICEGVEGIKKVVPTVGTYLQKHQEFNLLNRDQVTEVVGNALATRGVFNETLAEDAAILIYKTGLKVNRPDIIYAWKTASKQAEHDVMLEQVTKLAEATESDFPALYDQYLDKFFMTEAIGETTRLGLANALELLKEKIQDPTAQAQMEDLLTRLKNPSTADDQAVWDTMNLMAKTNTQMENMQQFDAMPGADAGADGSMPGDAPPTDVPPLDAPPAPAAPTGQPAQTIININTGGGTPSISGAPPAEPSPQAPPTDDLTNALDGIDLESGGDDAATPPPVPGGAPPADDQLQTAGLERDGSPLNEDDQSKLDSVMDKWFTENVDDAGDDITESLAGVNLMPPSQPPMIDHNYGVKILKENVVAQQLQQIDKLAQEKNLKPEDLQNHLDELAGTALAGDPSLKDPVAMQKAKQQLIGAYTTQQSQKKQAAAGAGGPMAEDQVKWPTKRLARRGLKKTAINALVTENKLEWLSRNEKAVLGNYKGIPFTIDNEMKPAVLLNHDGSVEIPIPEGMVPGALYLCEMVETVADADTFVEWLDQNIESLRPITEAEEQLVQEAIAKLTVSPDVKVEIAVDTGGVGGPAGAIPPAAPLIEPEGDAPPIEELPPEDPIGDEPPVGEETPPDGEIPEEPGDDDDEDLEESLQQIFGSKVITDTPPVK